MIKKAILLTMLSISTLGSVYDVQAQSEVSATTRHSLELNEKAAAAAKQGHFDQAESFFKQAIDSDPYNLTAVYNLAGVYAINKKETEAQKLLETYVKRVPKDASLRARLGDIYFSLKQIKPALKQYEDALALDPNYQGLYAKMAPIYIMVNNTKEAEFALRVAIKENPKNATLYRNFSAVLLANKKYSESIAAAKKALQIEGTAETYITLGAAYEHSKDLKNALIAYQRAQDLGDTKPELKAKIDELMKVLK